jgi:hypothetical protein
MWEAVCATLNIVMWIGVVLGLLLIVNTMCGVIYNLSNGEPFSWQKLFQGIGKAFAFYIGVALLSIVSTLLPFVNAMVVEVFHIELLSSAVLDTLSTAAIFGIAAAAITVQGKKALENIFNLSKISLGTLEMKKAEEKEEKKEE